MFNKNHSLQGNYILTFTGGMLCWQCNVDLNKVDFFFLIIFFNNIQMINGRMICTIFTPDMLPLCCPATGLDLGTSEVAFLHSFE